MNDDLTMLWVGLAILTTFGSLYGFPTGAFTLVGVLFVYLSFVAYVGEAIRTDGP
ncbi:hypothetical protein [Streptomyces sp. WM6378]|uniref:hypothetical protein n=1 Tax=Streptomyces sp. WM6378 TaxID=1415557 RepID=UPI000B17B81D|nr:hypothetical protein [Streptomyces sp. WM6378]